MHNRRYSASVIMQVTYGRRIPVCNTRHYCVAEIQGIVRTSERFTVFSSDSHIFAAQGPFLWKFSPLWPIGNSSITLAIGKPWEPKSNKKMSKSTAAFGRVSRNKSNRGPRDIAGGRLSFCRTMKATVSMNWGPYTLRKMSFEIELMGSGSMIEAGSETTSQALNNCIIGLLSNPEAVRKAHEELDSVVGDTRTPTFEDEKNLPWVRAIVQVFFLSSGKVLIDQELLRWRPVNKFGMNHCNTEDDWYNGYFIPKGSVVMINWWALHYDPEYYPEPEKVIPSQRQEMTISSGRNI